MAPPILFAAFPAIFAVLALLVRRYRMPILGSAVASFAVGFPSTGLNPSALTFEGQPEIVADGAVRVVQLNTDYWGQMRDGTLTDPRDKEAMLAYLKRLDADVYLLQEHMNRDGDLAPPVTDLSDVERVFPDYEAVTAGTLLTLSRLPVEQRIVVPTNNEPTLNLPPAPYILRTDVRVGDETLSTYNVHMPIQIIIERDWLSAEFYDQIYRRHHIRAEEYRALRADVLANPNALVISGDFNTSQAMGDNRDLLEVTTDATKFSAMMYPVTWRIGGQLPQLWRNDWFLVRNDLSVERFEYLDPEGNSDHLAQRVEILLVEPGEATDVLPEEV